MIADHVHDLENCTPDMAKLVTGDFNHCDLNKALLGYQQVTCTIRGHHTLDLFYCNIKDAYTSAPLQPLGCSDHNLVSLLPRYRPCMQRELSVMKTVSKWTKDAWNALKGCFDCTDWSVFTDTSDVNEPADTVCEYINFCVESKKVKIYQQNSRDLSH